MDRNKNCRNRNCKKAKPPHFVTPIHRPMSAWKGTGKRMAGHLVCTPARIVNLHANRTLSLQDLSPGFREKVTLRRSFICQTEIPGADNFPVVMEPVDSKTRLLAFFVYSKFLKALWRKRKVISNELEINLKMTNEQMKCLKAQVKTLKSLLTSDEQIISSSFREVQSLKGVVSNLEAKYKLASAEKEELEARSQHLRDDLLKMEAESSNHKNTLILTRSELVELECQLQKEKERSSKLKKETKTLIGKIETLNNSLKLTTSTLDSSEKKTSGLQDQLRAQTQLLKETQVKVEDSTRALECAERQMELLSARLKEERAAFEVLIQEEKMKRHCAEDELAFYKAPPLKTKLIWLTEWLITIPQTLSTW